MKIRIIMRRTLAVGVIHIVLFMTASMGDVAAQQQGPNIVLIMADDLGFECLEVNGGESYRTPFLNKLAADGVRFENCHSQPLCTPSRAQIMTGKYNVRNYRNFGVLERDQTTFAHLFKDAGYSTCIAGKWQLGSEEDSPAYFGFDEYCLWQHTLGRVDTAKHDTRFSNPILDINGTIKRHEGEYGPDIVSDYICEFIDRNTGGPFLAYYPMILTHCPFVPTPDSENWDPTDMGSLTYKGDTAYYSDMVNYMDKLVGKIIAKLDEKGLRENTLILFTGDNGTDQPVVSILDGKEYPGGKSFTTDNGTHVPLIASWNGEIKKGWVCDDLIDFTDILPTICKAAQIDIPKDLTLDGRDFMAQLYGKRGQPRDWIYGWYCPRGVDLKVWTRNEQYKLYTSGEFYNVERDMLEKKPLDTEGLKGDAKKSFRKLGKALSKYENARPQNYLIKTDINSNEY
jgi:arylsulfatase A